MSLLPFPLPPITQDTNPTGCAGIKYNPFPSVIQTFSYDIETNSLDIPLNLSIIIPKFRVIIPLNKIVDKVPIFSGDCDFLKGNSVWKGVICGSEIAQKKVCVRVFRKKICVIIPYPSKPKFFGQIYLNPDNAQNINLFTIPELGFKIDGKCSMSSKWKFDLVSNTPLNFWIDFLIDFIGASAGNGVLTQKDIYDRLIIGAQKTVGAVILQLIKYYFFKKIEIELSLKIKSILITVNWNIDYLKLYADNEILEVRNLTYTFKDIDVLKLAHAESIDFTVNNKQGVLLDFVVGTYELSDLNMFAIQIEMLEARISILKAIPGWEQLVPIKHEIETLEKAIDFTKNLANFVNLIPGINIDSIPYLDSFLKNFQPKLIVRFRICPLTSQIALCGTIVFDLTKYLKVISDYMKNINPSFTKYLKIPNVELINGVPLVQEWNNVCDSANKTVNDSTKIALNGIANTLYNNTQKVYLSATMCIPM